jgi:hypothetical protein
MVARSLKFGMLAVAILFCLGLALPAHAQSCSLCYTQAASSGPRIIQALRSGILILVIPPAFMSVGITMLAWKKRKRFANPEGPEAAEQSW